jgi:hypothetical protein
MDGNYIIELQREGLTENKHVRGVMRIKNNDLDLATFFTLERGHGMTDLKIGEYEMEHSIKRTGRKVRCLRPTDKRIETLLIHDAMNDDPNELLGCIAPFQFGSEAYKQSSAEAMETLWLLLGGWEKGKKVTLRVLTNVPGEKRTKETWWRTKAKK